LSNSYLRVCDLAGRVHSYCPLVLVLVSNLISLHPGPEGGVAEL